MFNKINEKQEAATEKHKKATSKRQAAELSLTMFGCNAGDIKLKNDAVIAEVAAAAEFYAEGLNEQTASREARLQFAEDLVAAARVVVETIEAEDVQAKQDKVLQEEADKKAAEAQIFHKAKTRVEDALTEFYKEGIPHAELIQIVGDFIGAQMASEVAGNA